MACIAAISLNSNSSRLADNMTLFKQNFGESIPVTTAPVFFVNVLEQNLVEPHFIRCHTGFIVNLLYFEKLEQNDMILLSGERVPVSRNRKKEVLSKIESLYSERVES